MIDKLKYEEVLAISKELKKQADIIDSITKDKEVSELTDFANTIDGYSKFLENTVELYKDADNALKDLK